MKTIPITQCKYELKFPYFVTDTGLVYSEAADKYLSPQFDRDGYVKVQMISTDGKRHRYSVHRLVLENFSPRDDMKDLQVNHIDGDKTNNNLVNLEWCTCEENIKHAIAHNLRGAQFGEHNPGSKLTEKDVLEIVSMLQSKKYTSKEISRKFGVCEDYPNSIRRGEHWAYLVKDMVF